MGSYSLASDFRVELQPRQEVVALVPEHNLSGLVYAHHMAPGVAPGHSVDSSTEEKEGEASGVHQELGLQPGAAPHYWTWVV